IILYAGGNLAGPLTLGRLFDTLGRRPMIVGTYLGSAAFGVVLAILFAAGTLNSGTFILLVIATFFLASAGASAAYLTASEIFPMETRALAIAFFYAIGTAVGGITGPLLFGNLIGSGHKGSVAIAFGIGALVMTVGGVAELAFGVKAEGRQLEDIARPLSTADAESDSVSPSGRGRAQETRDTDGPTRRRYRPGPGRQASRIMGYSATPIASLNDEVAMIQEVLAAHGPLDRAQIGELVGARFWGPGVLREALRQAAAAGLIARISSSMYGPVRPPIL
ncbi:MAG: MFS transporter, partial [Acidimicrobiales bacterium]